MAEFGIDDLQELVWDRMPARKYVAGREFIYDLTLAAIQEWPAEKMLHIQSGTSAEVLQMNELKASLKRHITLTHGHEQRYGFIWTLVLSAVISELVRVLLNWWWNNRKNREHMAEWQKRWRNG